MINDQEIVIIGGINENIERLNDVWIFSVKEKAWTEVKFGVEDLTLTHDQSTQLLSIMMTLSYLVGAPKI